MSRLIKALVNVVTCSAVCYGNFSEGVNVKVNLFVPTADKSSVNLKN